MFSKRLLALSLTASTMLSLAQAEMPMTGKVDLSVDLRSGHTFVTQLQNNSAGTIDVIDSVTSEKIETLTIPHTVGDHQEIEISDSGLLFYLNSSSSESVLGVFDLNHSNANADFTSMLNKYENVQNLEVEPGNKISFQATDRQTKEDYMIVLSVVMTNGTLQLVEYKKVTAKEFLENLQRLRRAELKAAILQSSRSTTLPSSPVGNKTYDKNHGLGVTAGFLSGLGFAYRQYFSNGWGYQGAGGVYATQTSFNYDIAAEVLRTLATSNKLRFYALGGANWFYSGYEQTVYDPNVPFDPEKPDTNLITQKINSNTYNFGAGLGFEWQPAGLENKGLGFSLEFPLMATFTSSNDVYAQPGLQFDSLTTFWKPSAAIIYYFGR